MAHGDILIVEDNGDILDLLSDNCAGATERSVEVLIAGLRKKLHGGGRLIETVRGAGYKLRG